MRYLDVKMNWDPTQYARYADERGRPFLDLLARVGATAPNCVVDLGCGPGTLTALLAHRWPDATVVGIDSSPEMITAAASVPGVSFELGSVETWTPDADVIISNATLQWVPAHRDLLTQWAASLPAGGWLAFQVPGNFGSPSHRIMREVAERFGVAGALRHEDAVAEPVEYASVLLDAGLVADVWETTYVHVLQGPDPVLEWVRGTGLRPVLAALPEAELDAFTAEYAARLREAYPPTPHGTLFPFRRIFAVGRRP